jgi:hypothetical protein
VTRLLFLGAAIAYGIASWLEYGPSALALGVLVVAAFFLLGRRQQRKKQRAAGR